MQSGSAKTKRWVMECDDPSLKGPEPLMGWTACHGTEEQVRLYFSTKEEAIQFVQNKGWQYSVAKERVKRVKPRNYSDNFRYFPPEEQSA